MLAARCSARSGGSSPFFGATFWCEISRNLVVDALSTAAAAGAAGAATATSSRRAAFFCRGSAAPLQREGKEETTKTNKKTRSRSEKKTKFAATMSPVKTQALRDKLDDDSLDLSLMQLEEVPVKEIVSA